MRYVTVTATASGRTAADLYPIICDFPAYADVTDAVLAVTEDDLGDGRTGCTWEVQFRRGVLKWSEEDRFDPTRHRVDFALIEGDLDGFVGHWQLDDEDGGCRISFACEFDMGIPTLAHVIEPIAEQTLRENVALILRGLFDDVVIDDGVINDGAGAVASPGAA